MSKHFAVSTIKSGKSKGKLKVQMKSGAKVLFTADKPRDRMHDVKRFCAAINPSVPIREA